MAVVTLEPLLLSGFVCGDHTPDTAVNVTLAQVTVCRGRPGSVSETAPQCAAF
jgi:hypothetical protein